MFTFATLRPKNGNFWADMKCAPDKAEELIEQYGDIFWGPFSDKKHWITVYLEGDVPDKLIKELISHSVEEVIKRLFDRIGSSDSMIWGYVMLHE